jgi:hypothetical protein
MNNVRSHGSDCSCIHCIIAIIRDHEKRIKELENIMLKKECHVKL